MQGAPHAGQHAMQGALLGRQTVVFQKVLDDADINVEVQSTDASTRVWTGDPRNINAYLPRADLEPLDQINLRMQVEVTGDIVDVSYMEMPDDTVDGGLGAVFFVDDLLQLLVHQGLAKEGGHIWFYPSPVLGDFVVSLSYPCSICGAKVLAGTDCSHCNCHADPPNESESHGAGAAEAIAAAGDAELEEATGTVVPQEHDAGTSALAAAGVGPAVPPNVPHGTLEELMDSFKPQAAGSSEAAGLAVGGTAAEAEAAATVAAAVAGVEAAAAAAAAVEAGLSPLLFAPAESGGTASMDAAPPPPLPPATGPLPVTDPEEVARYWQPTQPEHGQAELWVTAAPMGLMAQEAAAPPTKRKPGRPRKHPLVSDGAMTNTALVDAPGQHQQQQQLHLQQAEGLASLSAEGLGSAEASAGSVGGKRGRPRKQQQSAAPSEAAGEVNEGSGPAAPVQGVRSEEAGSVGAMGLGEGGLAKKQRAEGAVGAGEGDSVVSAPQDGDGVPPQVKVTMPRARPRKTKVVSPEEVLMPPTDRTAGYFAFRGGRGRGRQPGRPRKQGLAVHLQQAAERSRSPRVGAGSRGQQQQPAAQDVSDLMVRGGRLRSVQQLQRPAESEEEDVRPRSGASRTARAPADASVVAGLASPGPEKKRRGRPPKALVAQRAQAAAAAAGSTPGSLSDSAFRVAATAAGAAVLQDGGGGGGGGGGIDADAPARADAADPAMRNSRASMVTAVFAAEDLATGVDVDVGASPNAPHSSARAASASRPPRRTSSAGAHSAAAGAAPGAGAGDADADMGLETAATPAGRKPPRAVTKLLAEAASFSQQPVRRSRQISTDGAPPEEGPPAHWSSRSKGAAVEGGSDDEAAGATARQADDEVAIAQPAAAGAQVPLPGVPNVEREEGAPRGKRAPGEQALHSAARKKQATAAAAADTLPEAALPRADAAAAAAAGAQEPGANVGAAGTAGAPAGGAVLANGQPGMAPAPGSAVGTALAAARGAPAGTEAARAPAAPMAPAAAPAAAAAAAAAAAPAASAKLPPAGQAARTPDKATAFANAAAAALGVTGRAASLASPAGAASSAHGKVAGEAPTVAAPPAMPPPAAKGPATGASAAAPPAAGSSAKVAAVATLPEAAAALKRAAVGVATGAAAEAVGVPMPDVGALISTASVVAQKGAFSLLASQEKQKKHMAALKRQVAEERGKREEAQQGLQAAQQKVDASSAEQQRLQQEADTLKAEVEALRLAEERSKARAEAEMRETQEWRRQREELEGRAAAAAGAEAVAASKAKAMEARAAELEKEVAGLKADLAQRNETEVVWQHKLNAAVTALSESERLVANAEARASAAEALVEQERQAVARGERERAEAQEGVVRELRARAEERDQALEAERERFAGEIQELKDQLAASKAQVATLENDIGVLTKIIESTVEGSEE